MALTAAQVTLFNNVLSDVLDKMEHGISDGGITYPPGILGGWSQLTTDQKTLVAQFSMYLFWSFLNRTAGAASGTFTTSDGKTVTVTNGIISGIV